MKQQGQQPDRIRERIVSEIRANDEVPLAEFARRYRMDYMTIRKWVLADAPELLQIRRGARARRLAAQAEQHPTRPLTALAREWGVTYDVLSYAVSRYGNKETVLRGHGRSRYAARNEAIVQVKAENPGLTLRELSAQYGVSRQRIGQIYKQVTGNRWLRKLPGSQHATRNEAIVLAKTENPQLALRALSQQYGVSESTIYNIIRQAKGKGWLRGPDRIRYAARDEAIVRARAEDPRLTLRALAQQHGVSAPHIYKIIQKAKGKGWMRELTRTRHAARNEAIVRAKAENPRLVVRILSQQYGLSRTYINAIIRRAKEKP